MNFKKCSCLPAALLIALAALALTTAPARACGGGIICVDADAPGPAHDGQSWATAYTTVQDALDWTNTHTTTLHEIWVAEGVYYPDEGGSHVNDDREETFLIAWNNVQLYGGFAATETWRMQRNWTLHPTILSGDIDGYDANTDGNFIAETWNDLVGENAYHVLYLDGATNESITGATVLDGFTITAGDANGNPVHQNGSGLYCAGSGSGRMCNPVLTHITFSGNQAGGDGGGMCNDGHNGGASNPTLSDVVFSGNYAFAGGGMSNEGGDGGMSNPVLKDVTFTGNATISSGGGMLNISTNGGESNPTLADVIFSGNSAEYNGGGMYNYGRSNGDSSPALTNVIFSGNYAGSYGGGMFNDGSENGESAPVLANVTSGGNRAGNSGGGMYNYGGYGGVSRPTLVNCILWGNTAPDSPQLYNEDAAPIVAYSDVQWPGGVYTGMGNLNADPQFVAPVAATAAPTVTGDYRLKWTSPAIDAGNSLSVTVATDLDGNPRKVDAPDVANTGVGMPPVDMGAYERQFHPFDIAKSVTPTGDIPYHGLVTYTVVLSNTGALSDTVVVLTDTLPAGTAFVQWLEQPGSGLVRNGNAITWTGTLWTGAGVTLSFTARHTGGYGVAVANTACFSGAMRTGAATAVYTTTPNYPPVLDPIGDFMIPLGTPVAFNAAASDPNGYPPLVYSLAPGSVGFITPGGFFTWTPGDVGIYTATVRVSDGELEDRETFSITVGIGPIYALTVNVTGNGTVDIAPEQSGYFSGTVVTLTATPEAGWQFSAWSGDLAARTTRRHRSWTPTRSSPPPLSRSRTTSPRSRMRAPIKASRKAPR
ncbi:MAG: DUF11 domain-containing protein [Anaerolineae bacterium]|nr:DUF11 domain-containing protein [Anaerolineae bacterium]